MRGCILLNDEKKPEWRKGRRAENEFKIFLREFSFTPNALKKGELKYYFSMWLTMCLCGSVFFIFKIDLYIPNEFWLRRNQLDFHVVILQLFVIQKCRLLFPG